MAFRPSGLNDGSRPAPPIPITATVAAGYGDDPALKASYVSLSFAPTPRPRVDEAVAAFIAVMEAEDG